MRHRKRLAHRTGGKTELCVLSIDNAGLRTVRASSFGCRARGLSHCSGLALVGYACRSTCAHGVHRRSSDSMCEFCVRSRPVLAKATARSEPREEQALPPDPLSHVLDDRGHASVQVLLFCVRFSGPLKLPSGSTDLELTFRLATVQGSNMHVAKQACKHRYVDSKVYSS